MSFRNRFGAFLVIMSTFAHIGKCPKRALHTVFRQSQRGVPAISTCRVDRHDTLFLLKRRAATTDLANEKVCKNEQKVLILQGLVCISAVIIGQQATEGNQ